MIFSSTLVLFVLEVVVSGASEPQLPRKVYYDLANTKQLFKSYLTTYDKTYYRSEYERRIKIFEDNLANINKWNREHANTVFGIGPFTDMTYEEFVGVYTGMQTNFTNKDAIVYKPNGRAPETLDWRQNNYVSEVKNQRNCGSCYVFSAIGNIEGQYAKLTGKLYSLSNQQGLDCDTEGSGCNGGFPHGTMQSLANQGGCMRESDYPPYEAAKRQCRTDRSKDVVRVTGGNTIQVSSEEQLKDAVASYGPLSIGIFTTHEMQHLTGGVYSPQYCQGGRHAVVLVGYGTDRGVPYWLIKNSWGANWNEGGYLRLVRGQKACDIGQYVASATVST